MLFIEEYVCLGLHNFTLVSSSYPTAPGVVMEDPYWQSFMELSVRLMYFLAESPDQLCSRLLQRCARLLLDQIVEGGELGKDAGQIQDGSQESNEQGEQGESLWSTLTRCNLSSILLMTRVHASFSPQ